MGEQPQVTRGQQPVVTAFKSFNQPAKKSKRLGYKPLTPAEQQRRAGVRVELVMRDGGCLLASYGPCFGSMTPHHRLKAGQGGAYDLENLVVACQFHNDEMESDADLADWARRHGFTITRGSDPAALLPFVGCPASCPVDHRLGATR